MAKKIPETSLRSNNSRIELKKVEAGELRTFAIRKVRQQQKGKKQQSKISKIDSPKLEKNRAQTRVEKELFEQIVEESVFECPVCLQLMIEPTLLQCGHAYCFKCLQQLMIYKSCCGVCRNVQNEAEFQRSKHLETMIESMILKKSQNYLQYYCRVTDTENWKRVRNVPLSQLSKGSLIDFRDRELKWRKAEIQKIVYEELTGAYQLIVKYKKEGEVIEQTISSDSGRYTKFSYYTRMKYLEQKPTCLGLEQYPGEDVLYIPFTGGFGNYNDGMEMIPSIDYEDNVENSLETGNIDLVESVLPMDLHFGESSFLDEIFQTGGQQATDLIQLLG